MCLAGVFPCCWYYSHSFFYITVIGFGGLRIAYNTVVCAVFTGMAVDPLRMLQEALEQVYVIHLISLRFSLFQQLALGLGSLH